MLTGLKPIIQIEGLKKGYKRKLSPVVLALKDINLEIYPGEICCIFGTSGSGKSTLLNMVSGLERPNEGTVRIFGNEITGMTERDLALFRQKHLGYIFQSYNLLPGLNAIENVSLPLSFKGVSEATRKKIAKELLKRVGLENRMEHYPRELSGGQQQRVGIARAFITQPQLIFADEPTGNLDTETTREVMEMILGFARQFHQTILIVTHDPNMAQYATRIIHMVDGCIVEDRQAANCLKKEVTIYEEICC